MKSKDEGSPTGHLFGRLARSLLVHHDCASGLGDVWSGVTEVTEHTGSPALGLLRPAGQAAEARRGCPVALLR